ncbi:MAG TPA: DUF3037 domain-containing protein [Candidatus Limnocylindrales bacterium]|jgi:hypothetical protein|nr:DUF3037 domain-containing protein [Candidatus Limnocylindrales bacterium]
MPTGREGNVLAYYSLLRWTPDPLLGETINVGLLLLSEDGQSVQFQRRPLRSRAAAIATPEQIEAAEDWVGAFDRGAKADIEREQGPSISPDDLRRWSAEGVGTVRFAEPVATTGSSVAEIWDQVASRFLGAPGFRAAEGRETGRRERMRVVRDFVDLCRDVPSLKGSVHKDREVQGRRLMHRLDVTVQNGQLAAIAHAIPFAHGSPTEVDEKRALLVEAALDLPESVQKIAIYDLVPRDRLPLLQQSRQFIKERFGDSVQLRARAEFATVVGELARAAI